ncbi:MAG: hypothetical protein R6U32_04435 [Candidatus Woesearchaeota archaeon]
MDDDLKNRVGMGVEELILILLVIASVAEFLGVLPADFDYMKKILSWAALGYLLYKANLTEVFFGYKDKMIDLGLIIAYFMLVMKNLISYSRFAMGELSEAGSSFLIPLYSFIIENASSFEMVTFCIGGGIILLLAALNIFLNVEIKEPSVMAILFREGPSPSAGGRILRALASFAIYSSFFVVVFNLLMEWLGWAVDSTIIVVAIFVYLFLFMKHYRKFDTQSFLFRVGDVCEDLYARFIDLFHSRRTLMMGVSGLLVLHLLTDIGNFIIPYMIGKEINYFSTLGAGHNVIPYLLSIDMGIAGSAAYKLAVLLVYALNIAAIILLLAGPAFIWYEMYMEKRVRIPAPVYGLFFASFFTFLVSPLFRLQRIGIEGVYGVDIMTRTISVSNSMMVMASALVIGVTIWILGYNHIIRTMMRYITLFAVEIFFAFYIYLFFTDLAGFYMDKISSVEGYFILFYLFVFLAITSLFYVGGIAHFIYSTIRSVTKNFI